MKEIRAIVLRWVDSIGPLSGLGICRSVLGLMVVRDAWGYLQKYADRGFYLNQFNLPYADWYPAPTEALYFSILIGLIVCGMLMAIGALTKPAVYTAFVLHSYHLGLNEMWYRHNRYFLALGLLLLSLAPCDRAFSLASSRVSVAVGSLWSSTLLKIQLSLIYLASALSKTLDPDWSSGRVLFGRGVMKDWNSLAPEWLVTLLPRTQLVELITISALFQEFFLAIFLWVPLMRRVALWVGILFHGYIELRYSVITFSYLVLGVYFLFVRPTLRDRIIYLPRAGTLCRFLRQAIPSLDWLNKVELRESSGARIVVTDFDGRSYRGLFGLIILGTALPLTFFFTFPLSLVRHLTDCFDVATPKGREEIAPQPWMSRSNALALLVAVIGIYLALVWSITFEHFPYSNRHHFHFFDIPLFAVILTLVNQLQLGPKRK